MKNKVLRLTGLRSVKPGMLVTDPLDVFPIG
jgi:hypothetical protein